MGKLAIVMPGTMPMPSAMCMPVRSIRNSFIAEGSEIYGTIRHSIISTGCKIGAGALVEDSVIMPGVTIESVNAIVRHAILGEDSIIRRGLSSAAPLPRTKNGRSASRPRARKSPRRPQARRYFCAKGGRESCLQWELSSPTPATATWAS